MSKLLDTVKTGSSSMDYLRFGCGEENLIILPGATVQSVLLAADAIVDSYALLAKDFTIYLLDYGMGVPDPCSVHILAQDVRDALRALDLDEVHVFGASLGGMIAQVLAIENPGLVKKLVLGSTAARVPADLYPLFERWAALAEADDVHELYRTFGEAVYPPVVFEQLISQPIPPVADEELSNFAVLMRSMRGFDVTAELPKISCPVLAIGSHDDRIFGADGTLQIGECLCGRPDFEMHLYDGYGHAAYDTAPDYKDRLLRFLKSAETR